MRLLKILKVLSLTFVPIGLLVIGSVTATPPVQHQLASTSVHEQQELPITPSVTLTVCLKGPPTCDFRKIQDAINAAPETPPVRSWEEKPVIPLIKIAPGTYVENLVVLKNLWLQGQGAGHEQTIVRGQLEGLDAQRPTIFIAGSWPIAVGITGLYIGGISKAIQIAGQISGMISDNKIIALGEKGVGGIWLQGALAYLVISNNLIALGETGIHLENVSPASYEVKPSSLVSDPNYGVWIVKNEILEIRQREWEPGWGTYPFSGHGITLHHANGIAITRNRISKNALSGVFVGDAQTVLVSENTLAANGFGVWMTLPTNLGIKLLGNRIIANGVGISIWSGLGIEIEGNTISDNRSDGISTLPLPYPYYPLIEIWSLKGNRIDHNGGYGIDLDPQVIRVVTCKDNQVSSNQKGDYSSEELRAKCGG